MEPIFFDVECDAEYQVFLIAIRDYESTQQFVCDPKLAAIAAEHGLEVSDTVAVCRKLLALSDEKRRPIACYSSHDATVLATLCSESVTYSDMHKLAKKWIKQYHYDKYKAHPNFNRGMRRCGRAIARWKFISIAGFLDIQPPRGYAPERTLSRIRDVLSGLTRTDGRYVDLTPVQKNKCHGLIKHNRFDVEGLQRLFHRICSDLPNAEFQKLLRQSERMVKPAIMTSSTSQLSDGNRPIQLSVTSGATA
jgi:hypothetical protein